MDPFLRDAENILKAGLGVARCGERPTEVVILVGVKGQVQMLTECDWPLQSIRVERGARAAYRVTSRANAVVVEGEQAGRTCRLEQSIQTTARLPQFRSALPVWTLIDHSMPLLEAAVPDIHEVSSR